MGGMDPFPFPREGQKLGALGEAGSFRKAFSPRCGIHAAQVRGRLGGTLTVSRLRPLARLRLSTLRPPGVAIRARNPCVRLRLILLG
jgi:hypothetical protein